MAVGNPANTPAESLEWLEAHDMQTLLLEEASHWMPVDQPDLFAMKMLEAIDGAAK